MYANLSRIHNSLQGAADPAISWANSYEVQCAVWSSSLQKEVLLDLVEFPV